MITVILFLWCSAAIGYALRCWPCKWVGAILGYILWLLLFLLGVDVGRNPELIRSLGTLGLQASLAAILTVLGSSIAALLFWRSLQSKRTMQMGTNQATAQVSLWHQMKDSLIIVCFFACGCLAGYTGSIPQLPTESGYYTLCLLMGLVGFTIGQNSEIRQSIRQLDRRLMLLPLVTVVGTLAGIAFTILIIPQYRLSEWLAVGSGFGYYSLSGILVTEARGAELGTLALLTNILREIMTLVGAPLLCRWFSPLAPITSGGCTTEDTTLPVIARVCGSQFVPLSIFHGLTIDFAVPFLVSFFCTM